MSKVRIELIGSNIRDLLRSQEVLDICVEQAEKTAKKAGKGFEVSPYVGVNRVNASVYAATEEALQKIYDNTLLKSAGK